MSTGSVQPPLRPRKPHAPTLASLLLAPTPHLSARCGARARTTGENCRNWVCVGKSRCRMHGGAPRSGRPPTTGTHTAAAQRQRHFLQVVRGLLAQLCEKPAEVEAPETYEAQAAIAGNHANVSAAALAPQKPLTPAMRPEPALRYTALGDQPKSDSKSGLCTEAPAVSSYERAAVPAKQARSTRRALEPQRRREPSAGGERPERSS